MERSRKSRRLTSRRARVALRSRDSYATMSATASSTVSYAKSKPAARARSGSTRCPSSTTVAPSPSSALSANPGTGSQLGRLVASATEAHKPFIVVGCGAVALTTPAYFSGFSSAATRRFTRSSRWIQLTHWSPLPSGPPPYIWNTGRIFPSAPPPFSSTTPVRTMVVSVSVFNAAASHRTHKSARKSLPGFDDSVNSLFLLMP
mmetsp:Transcript_4573/g.18281  ORF Transcript_4573/g.18281 Transcript_4573/m.18281 type:complete len:204 (-) Transcript_4573:457-1068(-)